MTKIWEENIDTFLQLSDKYSVKMLMVGGGAVNFHGYQRHSADVDFWISTEKDNLNKLLKVFVEMGYEIDSFPLAVQNQEQNISVKFSPEALNLELITKFSLNKSFDEAYESAEVAEVKGISIYNWRVIKYSDLIESKKRAARPKDLLDIRELERIKKSTS